MYDWVTHTWNTMKGECPHGCHYCYMTKWGPQKPLRFSADELKDDLDDGNTIFVGSSCDMFANAIPDEWIVQTLAHCRAFDENRYLFQSKNPQRIYDFREQLPMDVIVGTTIESDIRFPEMGRAPGVVERAYNMRKLKEARFKTMITIEPVMQFNLDDLVKMITDCRPEWVNIGANTNYKVRLEEPSFEKIEGLIERLNGITEVKVKANLKRLRGI